MKIPLKWHGFLSGKLHTIAMNAESSTGEQLFIDEITFVLSGICVLIGFQFMVTAPNFLLQIFCGFKLIFLLIVKCCLEIESDFKGTEQEWLEYRLRKLRGETIPLNAWAINSVSEHLKMDLGDRRR